MKIPMRKALFALVPTVFLFGLIESILIVQGYTGTSIADIQFTAGFQQNAYVQRRDRILGNWFVPQQDRFISNPNLLARGFHDQSFTKQPQHRRYFALGGSTTYGSPFEHQFKGFPQRIEEQLNRSTTDRWEVINLGVAGMDSVTFPSILREIQAYMPEGILIYSGNNEVRGSLTERCSNPYRIGVEKQLNRLRTLQLLRDQFRRFRKVSVQFDHLAERQDDCMKREIQNLQYHDQIVEHQQAVRERFQENLRQTITIALRNNIDVFLAIPPINLLVPPVEQDWNHSLSANTQQRLQEVLQQHPINWEMALELDPSFALASYRLGMQRHQEGRLEDSRRYLQNAVSQDLLSQRITPELQESLLELCESFPSVHCIRVDHAFQNTTADGILDSTLFVDFCHPTANRGTTLIANAFVAEMKRLR